MAHKIYPSTKEAVLNSNGVGLGLSQLRILMILRLQLIAHQNKTVCDHPVPQKLQVWPMELVQLQGRPNPRARKVQTLCKLNY